jgi:transposase
VRLVRRHRRPDPPLARVVGRDDWAGTRRTRYGTRICARARGRPRDLLPARAPPTVAAWCAAPPAGESVRRAGSSAYAAAIRRGAPHARPVRARWQLTQQLAEAAAVVLSACLAAARRAAQVPLPERAPAAAGEGQRPTKATALQRTQEARRAERVARLAQITALRQQGVRLADIARQVGRAQRTVRAWLKAGRVPYARPRRPRAHRLDPYKPYLRERWQHGCRSGAQLERELRARGDAGSRRGVYHYRATLDPDTPPASGAAPPPPARVPLSPQQAVWRCVRRPGDLADDEREALAQLRQASPRVEAAYYLVVAVLRMVRERAGHQLDAWLKEVAVSQREACATCAAGLCREKDAVLAGLTLPWRTGPLAGQVHRVTRSTRRRSGRAGCARRRLRVLQRHPPQQEGVDPAQARGQRPAAARAPAGRGRAASAPDAAGPLPLLRRRAAGLVRDRPCRRCGLACHGSDPWPWQRAARVRRRARVRARAVPPAAVRHVAEHTHGGARHERPRLRAGSCRQDDHPADRPVGCRSEVAQEPMSLPLTNPCTRSDGTESSMLGGRGTLHSGAASSSLACRPHRAAGAKSTRPQQS